MPRARIPVTGITRTGAGPPRFTAVSVDGVSVANPDGRTVLLARNISATPHTLTVLITVTVDGQPVTPRTYTIPAGTTEFVGTFHPFHYSTTLQIDADSDDLAVAAVRLGEALLGDPITPAAFTFDPPSVVADLVFAGLTVDGNVLVIDTALTGTTVDGDVLEITV